jgi:hypothetical protein
MAWNPWDSPVDAVVLRGRLTPGVAAIENLKRVFKWDQVAMHGADAAIAIYRGKPPATFDIVIKLHNPEEYEAWSVFRQVVLTPPRPDGKALDIGHPFLFEMGIRSCVIAECGQPIDDGTGIWTVRISCVEFAKPRMALAKPDASGTKPAIPEPADVVIAALLGQIQEYAR